jgi:hypothetical protein
VKILSELLGIFTLVSNETDAGKCCLKKNCPIPFWYLVSDIKCVAIIFLDQKNKRMLKVTIDFMSNKSQKRYKFYTLDETYKIIK